MVVVGLGYLPSEITISWDLVTRGCTASNLLSSSRTGETKIKWLRWARMMRVRYRLAKSVKSRKR
jgi:hypothetical protein